LLVAEREQRKIHISGFNFCSLTLVRIRRPAEFTGTLIRADRNHSNYIVIAMSLTFTPVLWPGQRCESEPACDIA